VRDHEYAHLTPLLVDLASMSPDDPDRTPLRDKIVTGYLPVVRHIARRFAGRGQPADDLEQVGTIGLIGAVDRFQPERGCDFLSFAVPTITGEIRRHFRDHGWLMRIPRRLKDLQSTISSATDTLSHTLGRAPRPSELASHLGLSLEETLEALDANHAYSPDSLDSLPTDDDTALTDVIGVADKEIEKVEYRQSLAPLLAELPQRERTILTLRFFGEMTQTQIAHHVGLSQMHVSRLLAKTLAELRTRLADDGVAPTESSSSTATGTPAA
jgi:RNA polymerase sigma-B factor